MIAKSMLLFNIIKLAGAAYLVYMGYSMMADKRGMNTSTFTPGSGSIDYVKIFRDGMVTNLLNPKVALFFIAFLPQFIDPAINNPVWPFLVLGATFIFTGTAWCLLLACFADLIFARIKNNKRSTVLINRLCGLSLIVLGVKVAFTNNGK